MKVLLAIDSSEGSEPAVNEVARRPWPTGTVVRVLTVIDSGEFLVTPALVSAAREAVESLVRPAADLIASAGVKTDIAIIEGYSRTSIAEYAEEWEADFVFLGSHGHAAVTRFLLGSVAQAVLRGARCSVGIVRAPRIGPALRAGMNILVPTDGSDSSKAAIDSVGERPWPAGSVIKIVSVADVVLAAMPTWYGEAGFVERLHEQAIKQAEGVAEEAMTLLTGRGLDVSKTVLYGDPKGMITDEARRWDADLVVLGSHGHRGLSRILLGSVAEAVAMHAHCSVEVIRTRTSSPT